MQAASVRTFVVAGSLASIAASLYILFGNHNLFGDRFPLQLDVAALAETPTGPEILSRYDKLHLRCQVEQSPLGQQACWAEIGYFNGLPARHVAFYFDGQQRLTAFKLATDAEHYQALRRQFEDRFGRAASAPDGAAFLTWTAGDGLLAMPTSAPAAGDASALWLYDPRILGAFTAGGGN